MSDLPIVSGKSINPFDFPDEEFELYSVPSHGTGCPEIVRGGEIGSNKQLVAPGTVLLCKINPRINRTWIVGAAGSRRQIASTEWIAFDSCDEVDQLYLMFFMQQSDIRDYLAANASGVGGSLMRVKPATLKGLTFRMPGIRAQREIVEKLEELLSDLDAAVAELKAAQRKLAQYRQSLLKAAVEGALTADWRAARDVHPHTSTSSSPRKRGSKDVGAKAKTTSMDSRLRGNDGKSETGADLLQRILTKRRARWEQKQLAKLAAQGKAPPKGWQAKYPEPVAPDTTDLPVLPDGWVWACAEQLCEFITKGTTPPKDASAKGEKTVPFLRVTNLTNAGSLDLSDRVYVSEETHLGFLARSVVYPGDVLMNIVGPPLGQVSVVPDDFEQWNINQAIAIFRPVVGTSSQFICATLLSNPIQNWLKKRAKTTAGQTNLTLEICRALPLPLPPITEQGFLIETLGSRLEEQARQSAAVEHSLKQAAAQRKNILKAAFAGQLVPQDPNDEPASALLARIRAARVANDEKRSDKHGRKTKGRA